MFGEASRNKMLRKMSIHTYPLKNYLPIFDRSELYACAQINFVLCRKVHNAGILKNAERLSPSFISRFQK